MAVADKAAPSAAPVAADEAGDAAQGAPPEGVVAAEVLSAPLAAANTRGNRQRLLPSGIAVAAALGLCGGAVFAESLGSAPVLLGLSGAAVGVAILVRKLAFARLVGAIVLLAIAALAAQVGAWRMQATLDHMADAKTQVVRFGGAQQQIRGLVADDPAPRGRTTSLTLSDVLVRNGDSWQPLGAKVLVSVPHWPDHEYGEYLQLRGRLQALSGVGAIEALGRQGVLASMSYPRVSYLANPQANPMLVGMSRLRQRLGDTIGQTLPDPVAATLKATILGLRGALTKDEQQALVNTGTVHLVVISGFKLSLLAAGLQVIGWWILRRTSARLFARMVVSASVLAGIGGYTVLTGATPSAVRAAIMAGLVVFAALMGRPHDQVAALAIALLAIVGLSPLEVQDAGLQLSCLSVLGIAVLAEPLARWFRGPAARLPDAGWWARLGRMAALALAEAMGASLAATAFDVPVLANSFHVVSLISPVANLLGMPLLAPIMIFGGLGAGLGSLWLPLGAVFLWPAWAFTTLLDWLVNWTAGLPYAALSLDGMPAPAVVAYYALLLAFTWWIGKPVVQETAKQARASKRLAWTAMVAGPLAVGAAAAVGGRPPATVRTTLLAVPGQAALIQTPGGKAVLVDGGEGGPALMRELGQLLPPWQRSLDLVLITNPKSDRIGGLQEVFAHYSVGGVIEPDPGNSSATFRRLQSSVQRVTADAVDIGDGAVLRRDTAGWRIAQGTASVLVTEAGFEVHTSEGDWRIAAMLRGAKPPVEDELALTETGNVTVSLD